MDGGKNQERRGFRVSARTLLQLGGELISSDGIAFYELIKNAVDAGSPKILVEVVMRLPLEVVNEARLLLRTVSSSNARKNVAVEELKGALIHRMLPDAPESEQWIEQVRHAATLDDLVNVACDANSITFRDTGSGMSLDDLETVYLTVGTPHRIEERAVLRDRGEKKVILGEKGIGRLSAMRLGSHLFVRTSTQADLYWNHLTIDWCDFAKEVGQLLEDVEVAPIRGPKKDKPLHGTTIRITDLNTTWTVKKLAAIANTDLSRFTDPFGGHTRFPIHLRFNAGAVAIPQMSDVLRENAHAIVEADLTVKRTKEDNAEPVLSGRVQHLKSGATETAFVGRTVDFRLNDAEIASVLKKTDDPDLDIDAVVGLGPFSMQCLWFNRRILKAIDVDDTLLDLKKLVRQWSGGLMVYRDGFRVPPYGGPDDDWLDLDRGALASQGYKVNRAQLIGKVDISSAGNPRLFDQTNREGFRDCPEKRALVGLLKHVLEVEFRGYLKDVDDEIRDQKRISFEGFVERLAEVEEKINDSLTELSSIDEEHPDLEIGNLAKRFQSAFKIVSAIVSDVQESVETVEDERARVLHLAALGLSVEKLAHELNRASKHALEAVTQIDAKGSEAALKRTASLQLESLRKRLQNLDPLLASTRQRKEEFDLAKEVRAILAGWDARFSRHKIRVRVTEKTDGPVMVKFVRAMFMHILENLIDNSVYWLTVGRRPKGVGEKDREIAVLIDGRRNLIEFSDSGPGIAPENQERVFRPFFTRKPAGQGKGLGLYIAREIAEYHGGSLKLIDKGVRATGRFHTFQLDVSSGRL